MAQAGSLKKSQWPGKDSINQRSNEEAMANA